MKKTTAVRLLIMGFVLSLLLMPSGVSPTARADAIGNCDAPYFKEPWCLDFGWTQWCITEREACVNCDGGTFCYPVQ